MIQNINNTGAVVKEQIFLGNIDNLNIDDLFKDNTNNKKMKNNNYPTWLVPLEIAQGLKEIGFNEPCHFYYQNDYSECLKAGDPDKYHIISDSLAANRKNANHNNSDIAISTPTWEQVFEWFRAKGYKIAFKDINIGTQCAFYHLDIKEGHTFSHFAQKYEKAREVLVMKLIEVHKEFGNNIKRFD